MIRKFYRSLVLVACVLWATNGIAQHFSFTDVDPNGITVMAGSLALDGQTNWFYYNGSDAPQGGYNGWLFAGQPNTTSGTVRLPAVLAPGRYYIFLWGIDYDQNKTVQCSIGGA